jgi:DNA-nicking Smr family endonuclease
MRDDDIWVRYAARVTPLKRKEREHRNGTRLTLPGPVAAPATKAAAPPAKKTEKPAPPPRIDFAQPLTGKLEKKVKKGTVNVAAQIDLHGMRQAEAHAALCRFVQRHVEIRSASVLVITGKGSKSDSDGVLRRSLHDWLAAASFATRILAVRPAGQNDGAFYLILKRKQRKHLRHHRR